MTMTEKDKELLLKDLSARLYYNIKADGYPWITAECVKGIIEESVDLQGSYINIKNVRPYLRSMSSMTEEEDKEWQLYKNNIACACDENLNERINELYDWFNKHHLDWRGLIEKGLALEAPKDMYKF